MMPLSKMWNVDRTIDASGSSPVAARLLEDWMYEPGSVRFFRSSANFLYVFRHEGSQYFLRFADQSERSRESVAAEVALLQWLAGQGIDVAIPVRSPIGNYVQTAETEWGTFHTVVFQAIQGTQYDIGELRGPQFSEWGAALGKLHAVMKGCPSPITNARDTWRDRLNEARQYVPDHARLVRSELDSIALALEALPMDDDTYGLIHFDFELDNLIWNDRTVHILDFDGCARCWYEADIAFALRELIATGAETSDPVIREFVSGYANHHSVEPDVLARLPNFFRLADVLTYASIARALDFGATAEHPDWLTGLIDKLRNRMTAYELSLATEQR